MMFRHSTERTEGLIESFEAQDIQAIACCELFENVDDLRACYYQLEDIFTMVS